MGTWEPSAGASDDWYTPKYIFDALDTRFDLDVAAPPEGPRYVPADSWFSDHGLEREWHGFVWMNPPFGGRNGIIPWMNAFFAHNSGIALTPDRTSAPWWQASARRARAVLFINGKVKFERPDGSLGKSPSNGTALFAACPRGEQALLAAQRNGLGVVFRR